MEEFGPVQMLVIGFQGGRFSGKVLEELRRLRDHDIVRLVDLLFVTKDADGRVSAVERSDLSKEELQELGAMPMPTPGTSDSPGRWDIAIPAAPMNMAGKTGPPRKPLIEAL